ncbi:LysR family transcriptional regulator [Oricola sp.]|uniref:LysR family transcriptional regulator n=1 Tax=Oricola sp. TaxID=1979950 RepID=UPI000C93A4C9|nr:LysR family transcriptional regulator [Ahrensia sp.]|tara:strand:+ start:19473 stop:20363 length:891 start_codon:yes stop_codon:yes gene_type:complete
MKNLSWDDLQIFAHVARAGGLTGAAETLSLSAPTIGRRMLALEQVIGKPLFVRSRTGYALTDKGQSLLRKVKAMEAGARPIEEWLTSGVERPAVRLSAGTWTANFIAENFARVWTSNDPFRICFKTTEARLDIAHREVEIGIRNQPAESGNLASRPTVEIAFAPYVARNHPDPEGSEWVSLGSEEAVTRSARWLLAQEDTSICAWANTPHTLRDVVRAGAGRGVMPCFSGDRDPQLMRAGPLIAELAETQYLVMHNDDRHRPEVRKVIDRLHALFRDHAELCRGDRPIGTSGAEKA